MHAPERAVPAATQTVVETPPLQKASHLKAAPHAAAPAAVMSEHDRKQNLPLIAPLHVVYEAQREFGQSASAVHCLSQTRSVALYPMQFIPTPQSRLFVQVTPGIAAPAGAHVN
jgi:hypothetical protein